MRIPALLLLLPASLLAQTSPTVPPPENDLYFIDIRYRIDAFRNERVKQFEEMVAGLEAMEFKRDPRDKAMGQDNLEEENSRVVRIRGTIPAKNARKVARLRHVVAVLLKPVVVDPDDPKKFVAAPIDPKKKVRVELDLGVDLGGAVQAQFARELRDVLGGIGFKPALGHHTRGDTRVVGTIPAEKLEAVLNDVRRQPPAWALLPRTLLVDLRSTARGPETLGSVLQAWAQHPEGKQLVDSALEQLVVLPVGYRRLAELPAQAIDDATLLIDIRASLRTNDPLPKKTKAQLVELVRRSDIIQEQLLLLMQRSEDAVGLLTPLYESVKKAPPEAAAELMDVLLLQIESRDILLRAAGGGKDARQLQLFRPRSVIRVIEARPDLPLPEETQPESEVVEAEQKIGPSLREQMKKPDIRPVEIVLSRTPDVSEKLWMKTLLKAAPSLTIEGRSGPIVSGRMKPAEAVNLGYLPLVVSIREPREARPALLTFEDDDGDAKQVLKATKLDAFLRQAKPLRAVRVVVLDGDFRGWQGQVGKTLPARTTLLDLTLERNSNLRPDDFVGPAKELGSGTLTAMAVGMSAPWCELVLVRIDPATPNHWLTLVRRILGDERFSEALEDRRDELLTKRRAIEVEARKIRELRELAFAKFPDNKNQNDEEQIKKQKQMESYRAAQKKFDGDEKALVELETDYLTYLRGLRELKSIRVVVSGLTWDGGLPADGGSFVTRLIDEQLRGKVLWVQAAGNRRGAAWTGLFRDADGDGVMEFADSSVKLPSGSWSHDFAFLAWQPLKGDRAALVPPGTRVRVTMQWREAHDPEYTKDGQDPFRTSLSKMRLLVVRQLDPSGKARPADDFTQVASTSGPAQRIAVEEGSSVYEQVVEFDAPTDSRLALRVQGRAAISARPEGTTELPGTDLFGEIRPRIVIDTLKGAGRLVFESHARDVGAIGIPADGRNVLTVGALTPAGKVQAYSSEGSPYGLELMEKPDVRTFDRLGIEGAKNVGGNAMSAGFVAGYAAMLLGHGADFDDLVRELKRRLSPP